MRLWFRSNRREGEEEEEMEGDGEDQTDVVLQVTQIADITYARVAANTYIPVYHTVNKRVLDRRAFENLNQLEDTVDRIIGEFLGDSQDFVRVYVDVNGDTLNPTQLGWPDFIISLNCIIIQQYHLPQ
ncbi:uncharacterized protein LOC110010898 isoform X2 [Jatropha curcas]|uniref:uncharacterized protein LOC110010898 isoform X2 n=1 Tax=Jatropha curcas TaxID=180498 RepID=UPI001893AF93|nr:uncharacterized protein LOC110010898 isoform X2 [Jatropha curcas]